MHAHAHHCARWQTLALYATVGSLSSDRRRHSGLFVCASGGRSGGQQLERLVENRIGRRRRSRRTRVRARPRRCRASALSRESRCRRASMNRAVDSHRPLPSGSFTSSCDAARPSVRSPTMRRALVALERRGEDLGGLRRAVVGEQRDRQRDDAVARRGCGDLLGNRPALARAKRAGGDEQPRRGKSQCRRPFGGPPEVDDQVPGALLAQRDGLLPQFAGRSLGERRHANQARRRAAPAARSPWPPAPLRAPA